MTFADNGDGVMITSHIDDCGSDLGAAHAVCAIFLHYCYNYLFHYITQDKSLLNTIHARNHPSIYLNRSMLPNNLLFLKFFSAFIVNVFVYMFGCLFKYCMGRHIYI